MQIGLKRKQWLTQNTNDHRRLQIPILGPFRHLINVQPSTIKRQPLAQSRRHRGLHLNIVLATFFILGQNIEDQQLIVIVPFPLDWVLEENSLDPGTGPQNGIQKMDSDPRMFGTAQQQLKGEIDQRVNPDDAISLFHETLPRDQITLANSSRIRKGGRYA